MLRIEHHPNGPRVYVRELRIHHGLTGAMVCALGLALHSLPLELLGAVLIANDAHDFPWRLRERALA